MLSEDKRVRFAWTVLTSWLQYLNADTQAGRVFYGSPRYLTSLGGVSIIARAP